MNLIRITASHLFLRFNFGPKDRVGEVPRDGFSGLVARGREEMEWAERERKHKEWLAARGIVETPRLPPPTFWQILRSFFTRRIK
jgi:hypothetical protein